MHSIANEQSRRDATSRSLDAFRAKFATPARADSRLFADENERVSSACLARRFEAETVA